MKNINDLIGLIGSFEILNSSVSSSFNGHIIKNEDGYYLKGTISEQQSKSIYILNNVRIVGTIAGIDVTLLNAYIISNSSYIEGNWVFSISAKASEIIIGRKIYDNGAITIATMNFPEIIHFFSEPHFKFNPSFSNSNPSILDCCFPNDIVLKDEHGTITISRAMDCSQNCEQVVFKSIPMISYCFDSPVSVQSAIEMIAKARNLFLFFADDYLPLHDIELADFNSPKTNDSFKCDYYLHINSPEQLNALDEPFFITSAICKQSFQDIWNKWNDFYSHKFITELFWGIIQNKSSWTNQFLNFSQAIELYENIYRSEHLKKSHHDSPDFASCIKDAFQQLIIPLSITEIQIEEMANNIKEARNFFTHYNDKKYKEPSINEVLSMSRVLHLVLLGLIYKHLGFPDEIVKDIKKYREFSLFNRDISVIKKEAVPGVDYYDYF